MDTPSLDITETISDAAAQILLHSFAVYRVEADTASKIRAAYRTAEEFFKKTTNEGINTTTTNGEKSNQTNKQDLVERYRRIRSGNLYGYNIPLSSKELFRTWYDYGTKGNNDNGEEQELENFQSQQPWPSNEFCTASFHLARDLHRLLSECLWHIHNRFEEEEITVDSAESVLKTEQGHSRKRRPIPTSPAARKRFRGSSGGTSFHLESNNGGKDCDEESSLGRNFFRPSRCPLDYFFYHNQFPTEINCSEHVDRGALVVVCLTDVPGLEVRSSLAPQTSPFLCPEALTNLSQDQTSDDCCPGLVCIMAGDQLSRLLANTNAPSACVHRVRNPLRRARLSISYELRLENL